MNPTIALLFVITACGGGGSTADEHSDGSDPCGQCGDDEICVIVYSDETTQSCEAIPEVCGTDASCTDDDCAMAMYDSCPESFVNTGCSDTFPPTMISCNP